MQNPQTDKTPDEIRGVTSISRFRATKLFREALCWILPKRSYHKYSENPLGFYHELPVRCNFLPHFFFPLPNQMFFSISKNFIFALNLKSFSAQ